MTEQRMRRMVIAGLQTIGAFAVENPACPGTPDVCTVGGWLELKIVPEHHLPARDSTRVAIDLRKGQRIWLKQWARAGGRAWTLTRILDEWFMHDGAWASSHLGKVPIAVLRDKAIARWTGPNFKSNTVIRAMKNAAPRICRDSASKSKAQEEGTMG